MKPQLDYSQLLNSLPKEIRDEILTLPEDEKYEVLQEIAMSEGTPIEAEDNETIYATKEPLVVKGGKVKHIGGDVYHISGRNHNDKKKVGSGIKLFAEEGSIVYSDKLKIGHAKQPGPVEIMGKDIKGKSYHEAATRLAKAAKKVEDRLDTLPKVDQIALDSANDMLTKIEIERDKLNHNLLKVDLPVKEQEEQSEEDMKNLKLEIAQFGINVGVPSDNTRVAENPYDRYLRTKEPEPLIINNPEEAAALLNGDIYTPLVQKIIGHEGKEGDNITSTVTGPNGLTAAGLSMIGDNRDPKSIKPQEAPSIIRKILEKHEQTLRKQFSNYDTWNPEVKQGLLDLAYNSGSITRFRNLSDSLRNNDISNAFLETLDIVTAEGYGVKGLAKRRADYYNEIASSVGNMPIILEVSQVDNKSFIYKFSDGTTKKVTPSKGMHKDSKNGVLAVTQPVQMRSPMKNVMEYGGINGYIDFAAHPFYTENIPEAQYGMRLKRYQNGDEVSDDDWIKKIMEFEATRGASDGTGLPNWGYNSRQPETMEEAISYFKQDYLPKVSGYASGLKEPAADFIYNTGREPRVYMLDQYLKSIGKEGLNNRTRYNIDINKEPEKWNKVLPDFEKEWNKAGIDFLPINEQIKYLNAGRNFYYQNINQVDGKPNPAYNASWKHRIGLFHNPTPDNLIQQSDITSVEPDLIQNELNGTRNFEALKKRFELGNKRLFNSLPFLQSSENFTEQATAPVTPKEFFNYYQNSQVAKQNTPNKKENDRAPFDYKSITNNLAEAAYMASLLGERVQAPPRFQLDAVNPFMNMEFIDPSRSAQRQLGSAMAAINYGTRGSGSNTGNQIAAYAQIADKMGDVAYQSELARNEFENQKMQGIYDFENKINEGKLQLAMQTAQQARQAMEAKRQQSNAAIQKLINDANLARSAKDAYEMMISQECYKLDPRTKEWVYNPDCAKIQYAKQMAEIQNVGKAKDTTPQSGNTYIQIGDGVTSVPKVTTERYGGKLKRPTYVSPKYM